MYIKIFHFLFIVLNLKSSRSEEGKINFEKEVSGPQKSYATVALRARAKQTVF